MNASAQSAPMKQHVMSYCVSHGSPCVPKKGSTLLPGGSEEHFPGDQHRHKSLREVADAVVIVAVRVEGGSTKPARTLRSGPGRLPAASASQITGEKILGPKPIPLPIAAAR